MPLNPAIGCGPGYVWLKLRAMAWLVAGCSAPAERLFDRMLQRWPADPYALASRAHQHALAGRIQAAIADAQALVAAHPAHGAAPWFNLAFLWQRTGDHASAEGAFRRALELDARLDRAWYGLGLTLRRLGRHDEAAAALERNTELQPLSPYGWVQLARLHAEQRQPERARKIIRHLQGFEPKVAAQLARETGLAP